jgi:UDP-glucose 4-epimerase
MKSLTPLPTSVYAATKLAGENLVNIYTQQGKVSGISLRLCAVTGKYSTHGIVHDFVKKLDSDSEFLEVLGSEPGSCKPFLYADDVCEAIAKTIQINPIGRDIVVNICNEGGATVKQVAEAVMQAKKIVKPIKWLGDAANWKGDNKLIKCDSTYAKEILDWEPKCNSYQAIFKAVEDKMLCQN